MAKQGRQIADLCDQRDRAWDIFPYPCIGQCRFLDLSISLSPLYPTILHRLKESNSTFLDIGCCFAQDIRKLVSDGAPSKNILGADLRLEFIDLGTYVPGLFVPTSISYQILSGKTLSGSKILILLPRSVSLTQGSCLSMITADSDIWVGYDLFRERDTLESKFLIGDVSDEATGSPFRELDGKIDIIYAASFFHLFNWEDQLGTMERVVRLLKPVQGSLILGRQRGNVHSGEYEHRTNEKGTMFRHNEESWKEMWKQVGKATGSSWDVNVWLEKDDDFGRYPKNNEANAMDNRLDSGDRRLRFEVTRL